MKKILTTMMLLFSCTFMKAQNDPPELEFVVELKVKCDDAYEVGRTSHGKRVVIPIVGGTFEGPKMKGTVLAGGADYQLADTVNRRTELEAIYSIRTDDGVHIHIRNRGLHYSGKDENGRQQLYFRTAPTFEAPQDSKYAWLNNAIYVCRPVDSKERNMICLRVWKVK